MADESATNQPKVVILGAGFAGMGAIEKLKHAPVQITFIDRNDFHTFQPLLYQLATDELSTTEVGFPVRDVMHRQNNVIFHETAITGVDLAAKQVMCNGMEPIPYDYLVIGLGAVVNFYGTKGADEHAFPLYTMRDALKLKDHLLTTLEAADKNPALIDDGALTICIVGGGPTGVETAGAMVEFMHAVAEKDYPNLPIKEKAQVKIFEHSPHLLGPFKPKLQDYAKAAPEKLGVEVNVGVGVAEIAANGITLSSGETVKTHTLVWAAGIQANPLSTSLGLELAHGGRVAANLDLSLPGHPEVFVVGDIALITDAKTNKQLPQLGSVAQQAGRHAGENIARLVPGQAAEPFKYLDKGTMVTVGRGAAVLEMPNHGTMPHSPSSRAVSWGWTTSARSIATICRRVICWGRLTAPVGWPRLPIA